MKIAIYMREPKGNERNIERKKREFSELVAQRKDCTISDFYIDIGKSGLNVNRSEYRRMIEDAKQHKFDYIVVQYLETFCRETITIINEVNKLKEIGVGVFELNNSLDSLSFRWIKELWDLQKDALWHLNRKNITNKVKEAIDKKNRP